MDAPIIWPNQLSYRICFNRFRLHMEIPYFDGQIITRDHIAPRIREFDVRYGWDYFGEETAIRWILRLLEDWKKNIKNKKMFGKIWKWVRTQAPRRLQQKKDICFYSFLFYVHIFLVLRKCSSFCMSLALCSCFKIVYFNHQFTVF